MKSNEARKNVPASVKDQVSEEEWNLRVDLAAAYRLVAHYGWDDAVFTHISVRVPGPEHHFLINPYGLLFDEITASSLVKIDLEGKPVLNPDDHVNAAGFTIHSAIHEAREDAKAVIHLDTVDGNAVSAMAEGLMPLNQTALLVRDSLAFHEFEGVALDLDERPRIVADLGDKHAMLLWNHGTLTVGETIGDAFLKMYMLERACSMQVRSLAGGGKLHLPSQEAIDTTSAQGRAMMAGGVGELLMWPAMLRKLDRIDPSFRD